MIMGKRKSKRGLKNKKNYSLHGLKGLLDTDGCIVGLRNCIENGIILLPSL